MNLDKDLKERLKEEKVPLTKGTMCLVAYYYGLDPSDFVEEEFLQTLVHKGFIDRIYDTKDNKKNIVRVLIPLFQGDNVEWDWLDKDFIPLFQSAKPNIEVDREACEIRMADLFKRNPSVTSIEVLAATIAYLRATKGTYIRRPHYFIRKGRGVTATSDLKIWLEKLRAENNRGSGTVANMME